MTQCSPTPNSRYVGSWRLCSGPCFQDMRAGHERLTETSDRATATPGAEGSRTPHSAEAGGH